MANDGRDLLRAVPARRSPRGRRYGETSSLRLPDEPSHVRALGLILLVVVIIALVQYFF